LGRPAASTETQVRGLLQTTLINIGFVQAKTLSFTFIKMLATSFYYTENAVHSVQHAPSLCIATPQFDRFVIF